MPAHTCTCSCVLQGGDLAGAIERLLAVEKKARTVRPASRMHSYDNPRWFPVPVHVLMCLDACVYLVCVCRVATR